MMPELFRHELDLLMPSGELRLSRDPHRLLMDLWVVERRIPRREYVEGLEQLRLAGESRYVRVPRADGWTASYYDKCPEWAVVHVCKAAACDHDLPIHHGPQCFREPDMRDVRSLREWLYGFRDFAHSMATLQRERRDNDEKIYIEGRHRAAKALKANKGLRGLRYSFAGDGAGSTTERVSRE